MLRRLLCRLGRHEWREVAFTSTITPQRWRTVSHFGCPHCGIRAAGRV